MIININEFDAVTFAEGLYEETDDNYYEIRGMYTKSGNPVTLDLR